MVRLAQEHSCTQIVDVGAGRGELLTALSASAPAGFGLHGADVVARPARLPERIGWSPGVAQVPAAAWHGALVIGWELLDVVPCSILEVDDGGELREVLVEPATGRERLGPAADSADLSWSRQWWPLAGAQEGDRVESGLARDVFWAGLVTSASGARTLLAVDYGHRRQARPAQGSLTGFRTGRAMPPKPDRSMDLTAHVAMDSVAAAGVTAGATVAEISTQSVALARLGVRSPELLDPGSLGGFDWLVHQL
jgi:SAM-dependent MidA family methyltransferase